MTSTYPGAVDSFSDPTGQQQNTVPHDALHKDADDAIVAIETELGVDGRLIDDTVTVSGAPTSVKSKTNKLWAQIKAITGKSTGQTAPDISLATVNGKFDASSGHTHDGTGGNGPAARPGGSASGDLSGSYPSPLVAKVRGRTVDGAAPADGNAYIWDAGSSSWKAKSRREAIRITIDGGGSVIPTGVVRDLYLEKGGAIKQVALLADQSGDAVVDLWVDTYGNYPPTNADSITASAPPTIAAGVKSRDSTLTGWTTTLAAGSTLRVNVDSAASITRLEITIEYEPTFS